MPSKPKSPGVPVRGECRAGHVIKTTATPGRSTWRGECPHEGCSELVIARRVATAARSSSASSHAKKAGTKPAGDPPATVRKVTYADDKTAPNFEPVDAGERRALERRGADEHTADVLGIDTAGPAAGGVATAPVPSDAEPAGDATAPGTGWRRWWPGRARRADGGASRAAGGEIIPGIY